eukprot:NODE_5798_length_554_cov_297.585170.p4 GENE.NODE_5798_length_554_cov_297.585170~~NODE_5798_length_554_cov_297.585170.p4  ORF type:complete len:74 (-),score=5.41 NODE_5798_length_554_cov_297.585170:147-368(-)
MSMTPRVTFKEDVSFRKYVPSQHGSDECDGTQDDDRAAPGRGGVGALEVEPIPVASSASDRCTDRCSEACAVQ